MKQLTNEMIIGDLNESLYFRRFGIIILVIIILAIEILVFIQSSKKQKSRGIKYWIINFFSFMLLFVGVPVFKDFSLYTAIQNSIKTNSFEVAIDTLVGKNTHDDSYYIF